MRWRRAYSQIDNDRWAWRDDGMLKRVYLRWLSSRVTSRCSKRNSTNMILHPQLDGCQIACLALRAVGGSLELGKYGTYLFETSTPVTCKRDLETSP